MILWQRLVASIPYVRTSQPFLIDTYAPQVTRAYIESRLAAVPNYPDSSDSQVRLMRVAKKTSANRNEEVENGVGEKSCPLDDIMTLTEQLDQVR